MDCCVVLYLKEIREFKESVVCGDGEVKWKLIRTTHLPTPHTPNPVKTTMPADVCYLGSTPSVCLEALSTDDAVALLHVDVVTRLSKLADSVHRWWFMRGGRIPARSRTGNSAKFPPLPSKQE